LSSDLHHRLSAARESPGAIRSIRDGFGCSRRSRGELLALFLHKLLDMLNGSSRWVLSIARSAQTILVERDRLRDDI